MLNLSENLLCSVPAMEWNKKQSDNSLTSKHFSDNTFLHQSINSYNWFDNDIWCVCVLHKKREINHNNKWADWFEHLKVYPITLFDSISRGKLNFHQLFISHFCGILYDFIPFRYSMISHFLLGRRFYK